MTTIESTATYTDAHEGVHLVILHHGLWGNKGHVKFIADQFKERFGDRILVYRAESNESSLTYDGIDICGQRAVQEIHRVIRVIEAGGNIEDLKGQKNKGNKKSNKSSNKSKDSKKASSADSSPHNNRSSSEDLHASDSEAQSQTQTHRHAKKKKVTQFSFLGYSLGGLIARFVMGLLELEKFFDPVEQGGRGIEPMYFVTMATPHLGIRQPPKTTWSKVFNYLSSRMLSRTGEQMQLVDDYIQGKPLLLVMSEPEGVFVKTLARFKRRVIYSNIRNDRSVPFWTASFSDADPFSELEAMEIQYSSGYSSLIESYVHHDMETLARMQEERAASLKATSLTQRASQTLSSIPWKKYAFFGLLGPILIPVWIVFASTTIGYQGLDSRRRTKNMTTTSEELLRIRERASTTALDRYRDDDEEDGDESDGNQGHRQGTQTTAHSSSSTVVSPQKDEAEQEHTVLSVKKNDSAGADGEESTVVSHSFPLLKSVQPLALLPTQVEMSKNLNTLEWMKNIVHIEGWNAHASIVVREKRFMNEGGAAAVQHAVDLFQEDGEDE